MLYIFIKTVYFIKWRNENNFSLAIINFCSHFTVYIFVFILHVVFKNQ